MIRRLTAAALPAAALSLLACEIGAVKPTDTGADSGRDVTDPGGDGGGTGGTGGAGETGDTAPVSDLECEGQDSSPPAGPDCVTASIQCGQTIEASTTGGSVALDEEFYQSAYCFVPYSDYAAPERVYALEVDGGGEPMVITVSLEAPCGDLSLAMFYWDDTESCPQGAQHNIANCDGEGAGRALSTSTYTTGESPDRYLIAVDGDAEAPFRLSVSCEQ